MSKQRKHVYVNGLRCQIGPQTLKGGGAAAGADNTTEIFTLDGQVFEIRFEQLNGDVVLTAGQYGLVLPNDNTDNDGAEITNGIGDATNAPPVSFTIGTDTAFQFILGLRVPDVSDYDVLAFGFRKLAAYADAINAPASLNGYTDVALFNINAGDLYTVTELNNGGITATDTTDNVADGGSHLFRVRVSAAGVVTFAHDIAASGTFVAPTVTQTYTFDTGDIVIPTLIYAKGAAASDTPPIITKWVVGYQ